MLLVGLSSMSDITPGRGTELVVDDFPWVDVKSPSEFIVRASLLADWGPGVVSPGREPISTVEGVNPWSLACRLS
jgi:hypothetical protein